MKIPPHVNIVRFTGLGLTAKTPKGFTRITSHFDARYAVRNGYRLEACPGEAHRDPDFRTCRTCDPMWGVVAVRIDSAPKAPAT